MKKLDAPQLVLKVLSTWTENHFPVVKKVDIKDRKILIQRGKYSAIAIVHVQIPDFNRQIYHLWI
ncbi:hypothetical protein H6F39_13765 [Anabaena sp. FACHB-1250]|uniref:Uncharacterized protein n=1 Tax=Dolichospermum planctonicum TaxID=136072 RepID=A0A480AIJ2_9CYAN|nr:MULTISPECIES: hypothetical protein [Nostocales]MBD2142396.1 hypothetical protein [Anabaena sp. FACHB-1250]MBD2270196.1 hypothetical protein [Anabaena sp. FACHB-1391]GCL41874.1 hypothetical protein NIES80_15720 [Dolichospermum planctonicum]